MSAAPMENLASRHGPPGEGSRAVFVTDFVHLAVPFGDLAPVLLDADAAWLRYVEAPTSTEAGARSGEPISPGQVKAALQVGFNRRRSLQTVTVTAGPARVHEQQVIVPISWEPTVFERLLPKLEADLELSALGASVTRLAINGRYRVPLGQLGLKLDRVAMHRVAESSLRRFLLEVQAALLADR